MADTQQQERKPVTRQWGEILVGKRGTLRCAGAWLAPVAVFAAHVTFIPLIPVVFVITIVYVVALFKVGARTSRYRTMMVSAAGAVTVCAAGAQYLWLMGFNAADAGNPVPFIAQFEPVFVILAVASAAAFIASSYYGSKHAPRPEVSC